MAQILHIETATKNCSVSLAENGAILASREINTGNYSHAEKLHVFIAEIMQETQTAFETLDAIAVSKGPGSYTGLRIGVSTAKGLAYAQNIPLISIPTLETLAVQADNSYDFIIPLLDARRMEVFCQVFDNKKQAISKTEAKIIDETAFLDYLTQGKVLFLGDGAEKCKTMITHPNACFVADYFPSALAMNTLALEKYKANDFEDTAYFEPFYLKDFKGLKLKDRKKKELQ